MTRDDGTPLFTPATAASGARLLRARDAVPADAGGHPARDRQHQVRRAAAGLHVGARLRAAALVRQGLLAAGFQ